jgi:hypothetical protein
MKIPGMNSNQMHRPVAPENRLIRSERSSSSTAYDFATISPEGQMLGKAEGSRSIAEIMKGVSFRNIRYSELLNVAKELKAAGHLAKQDYLDFVGPSPEFAMLDGSRNPDWNGQMDYIGQHEQNLAFMIATGSEQRFIDFEKHLLSLYTTFESKS